MTVCDCKARRRRAKQPRASSTFEDCCGHNFGPAIKSSTVASARASGSTRKTMPSTASKSETSRESRQHIRRLETKGPLPFTEIEITRSGGESYGQRWQSFHLDGSVDSLESSRAVPGSNSGGLSSGSSISFDHTFQNIHYVYISPEVRAMMVLS